MSEFQKMLSGELYNPSDNNLSLMRARARKLIDKFNHSSFEEEESRLKLLTSLLGKAGDNISIHQNFYCDYGCNIYVGSNFFAITIASFWTVPKYTLAITACWGPKWGSIPRHIHSTQLSELVG